MTGSKRKNVVLLSLTLGVVMLGFGMIMPIMPFYVERMGASASELGLLVAISPFIQLVASPLWGGVSDRRGRKPVLIGSVPTTTTLPFGTPDDVRREVARCVALARRRGGGFLLNASSSVGPEVPKENLYALFESAAAFPREASAMQDKPVAPSWTAPA